MVDAGGTLLGKTRVVHITDYPCFHERGCYAPGDTGAPVYATAAGRAGIAKTNSTNEDELLEHCLREDLNRRAPRVLGVLRPLEILLENYPEDRVEEVEAVNNPEDPSAGRRRLPFSARLWFDRDDFLEDPPKKFFRLAPGSRRHLERSGYFCVDPDSGPGRRVPDRAGSRRELSGKARTAFSLATRDGCTRSAASAREPPG